jgi:signal transduction histidine kinase
MILIVDDQQENILPLKKILELHGLDSEAAYSGEEALTKTLKRNYSLIIMDVQMPGMDGFEVAEALAGSSRTKDIPVIFLSAINKEKKYFFKGFDAGGVDYITKPADPDMLILKVKTFLKLYQQQAELKDMRDLLAREIQIRKDAQENLEQKVAERTRELLEKNEELELSNHELQQFAWVVSHDLKEPIRKIEIFVKLLKERFAGKDEKALDYAERTIRSAQRMSGLIDDLLAYSRLSSPVHPEPTNLNELIGEVIADFDYQIDQKKAQIRCAEIPEIEAVPSQLRQVFQNLIGNSLKFAREGVPPVIEVSCFEVLPDRARSLDLHGTDFVGISISDNGIGFDDQYMDRIFTIFQRLHPRENYDGTGIGLAIAKKIIEKHGGAITASGRDGAGATFDLYLPYKTILQT